MQKIIHLVGGMRTGGAETLIKDYALKMDKSMWEVVILCCDHIPESPYESILRNNGIRMIFIEDMVRLKCNVRGLKRIIKSLTTYHYVKRIIKREKPNVIHVHLEFLRFIKHARTNSDTKIFYTVHSRPSDFWSSKGKKKYEAIVAQLEYKAAKWLVKNKGLRFIALHDSMKEQINKIFNINNTVVLNNGIDFSRFEKTKSRNQIRTELGIPAEKFVVGHIGRFSPQKNHFFLLKIFEELQRIKDNSFLLMVGDGPDKERVISELDKAGLNNSYLILSNRGDVPDLFQAMDVFVFPSNWEGLGIVMIEAQKSGILSIASTEIPRRAIISNLATQIPLSLGEVEWASHIASAKYPEEIKINADDWDMDKVVERLGDIYKYEI